MNRSTLAARVSAAFALTLTLNIAHGRAVEPAHAQRLVILKIDGLGADLLYGNMRKLEPATGRPRLPWFQHIFGENGTVSTAFTLAESASQRHRGRCSIPVITPSFAATSNTIATPGAFTTT